MILVLVWIPRFTGEASFSTIPCESHIISTESDGETQILLNDSNCQAAMRLRKTSGEHTGGGIGL
jgi:hypothetical protein